MAKIATRSPTLHELHSALLVARMIDDVGNSRPDALRSYHGAATQGQYPATDLQAGELLLIRAGLVKLVNDELIPCAGLTPLVQLQDEEALRALAAACGLSPAAADPTEPNALVDAHPHDPALLAELGAAGEEAVVQACREELMKLDRSDLADVVQRVSLISDALGYDINAPMLDERSRFVEVKTHAGAVAGSFRFFLSRHEYEVGRREATWALVACHAPAGFEGPINIVGWCRAQELRPYLPEDGNGRWMEALVRLPVDVLRDGVPPAI